MAIKKKKIEPRFGTLGGGGVAPLAQNFDTRIKSTPIRSDPIPIKETVLSPTNIGTPVATTPNIPSIPVIGTPVATTPNIPSIPVNQNDPTNIGTPVATTPNIPSIPVNQVNDPTNINTNTAVQDPKFNLMNELEKLKAQGFFSDTNVLGNVSPEIGQGIEQNIQNLISGKAGGAQKAASNIAFADQIQDLRARGSAANIGQLGQGAAVQGQQGIEQQALRATADKQVQDRLADQQLRTQGTQLGLNLAQQNQQAKQFAQNLQLAFTGLAGDQQNLLTNLTTEQQNLLTKIDFEKAMNKDNLAQQLEMLGMQIVSNEKIQADKNHLVQQGINLEEAKLKGYKDPLTGKWVMGTQQMEMIQWQSAVNSQTGLSFANYVQGNLDANSSDPALKNLGQGLWEALGNEGDVPMWWLNQRIEAVKDPRLTNPIVGTDAMLKQALEAGIIKPEQYEKFMESFGSKFLGLTDSSTSTTSTSDSFKDFNDFVPTSFPGNISKRMWEKAGKPETFEEYQAFAMGKIGEGDLSASDLDVVANAIIAGDETAIAKFGIDPNSNFSFYLNNPGTPETTMEPGEDVAFKGLFAEAKNMVGKIYTTPSGRATVVKNITPKQDAFSAYIWIETEDVKTGKKTGKKFAAIPTIGKPDNYKFWDEGDNAVLEGILKEQGGGK